MYTHSPIRCDFFYSHLIHESNAISTKCNHIYSFFSLSFSEKNVLSTTRFSTSTNTSMSVWGESCTRFAHSLNPLPVNRFKIFLHVDQRVSTLNACTLQTVCNIEAENHKYLFFMLNTHKLHLSADVRCGINWTTDGDTHLFDWTFAVWLPSWLTEINSSIGNFFSSSTFQSIYHCWIIRSINVTKIGIQSTRFAKWRKKWWINHIYFTFTYCDFFCT